MKLHINFEIQGFAVDELLEGDGSPDILRQAKLATAAKLGLLVGSFVRAMPDLEFAREVVKRHNAAVGGSSPQPATTDEFVHWAVSQNLATLIEE